MGFGLMGLYMKGRFAGKLQVSELAHPGRDDSCVGLQDVKVYNTEN